ncbi:hypothetical protein T4B_12428 [Trichinella pseudospiralis]|uniref:Uncharacterized protein n=1 Tax=Trichinella pseudospiralis TaxID=6337 RepID=A0A0V1IG05_TRIPS|nr:hypothetical protein T4B_12428 [Trichinella pseudospiralis]
MHPATDLQLQQMNNFNNTEDYYSSFHYNDNNEAQIFEHNNQTVNLLHTIFGTFGFIANFLWAVLVMSVDFLLTILRSKFENYIASKWVIYLLIFIYLSCATADLIFCWSSSSSKRNQSISIVCAGADILSKRYLISHTVICSLLSYSAVAILFWSASIIKRQSSAIVEIQAIQHRRKTAVIKQLFYLILFTFIIQNMPFVAAFVILARKKNSLELDQVWLSQNMGLCFHGILRFIQQIPKNKNFSNQNCFCIIKRQNSVLSCLNERFSGYAVASVMTSATFILEYGRLLAYESSKSLVTPCYCIIYAVHPTLFAVLPITIAEIVFFMSWDVYVTISSTKCHGRKISRQQVVVIIAVYTFSIITMVSAAWWSAAYKKSQAISVVCMLTDVVTKGFLITLAVFTSVFSWGSLIFLICSTLSMKRHNPVSPGLQAILLRRKSKLVKNLFIIGIFTCLAQNLPFTEINSSDWISKFIFNPGVHRPPFDPSKPLSTP